MINTNFSSLILKYQNLPSAYHHSCANSSFFRLFNSITGTVTPTSRHSKEKQAPLMKEGRCFRYKKRGHTPYNCPKKGKIAVISEGISKNSNSQGKE